MGKKELINQTKAIYLSNIETKDVWLERAIYAIWKRQTTDEKNREGTIHKNDIGFNSPDGHFLTSLGNWLNENRYNRPFGERLTEKQKNRARPMMRKYAGQLVQIAKEKENM